VPLELHTETIDGEAPEGDEHEGDDNEGDDNENDTNTYGLPASDVWRPIRVRRPPNRRSIALSRGDTTSGQAERLKARAPGRKLLF